MNLDHLYYFKTLAKLQHYTKAAEQLHISQPNLSYAISALEEELGTHLFEKKGRNVILTKYGKIFLEYVKKSINELETGRSVINELVYSSNNKIVIASYRLKFVTGLIEHFKFIESNSNIDFTLHHKSSNNIIQSLKNKEIDLGFCSYNNDEPDLEFIPVNKEELVALVPLSHTLASQNEIALQEIASYPLIVSNGNSETYQYIMDMFERNEIVPTIACEAESNNASATLVANNFGIAITPNYHLLQSFNLRIKILPIIDQPYQLFVYMAYIKKQYKTPSVLSFQKFVINNSNI